MILYCDTLQCESQTFLNIGGYPHAQNLAHRRIVSYCTGNDLSIFLDCKGTLDFVDKELRVERQSDVVECELVIGERDRDVLERGLKKMSRI